MAYHNRLLSFLFVFVLMGFAGISTCRAQSDAPIRDQAIIKNYPPLYKAVFRRDADQFLNFTRDSSAAVRRQAWRALAQTPVDSIADLIEKVKKDQSTAAWFALSLHDMSAMQRRRLESYWTNHPKDRAGVSLVLGRQGDAQSMQFFLNHLNDISGRSYEKASALAVGRLLNRFSIGQKAQLTIIKAAFSSHDANLIRVWLYGFYRGEGKLSIQARKLLQKKWHTVGPGSSAAVDQYVAKVLGPAVFTELVETYTTGERLKQHVTLSIELAKLVKLLHVNGRNREYIKKLLEHPNPHVQKQTLANLADKLTTGDQLYRFISRRFLAHKNTSPAVWLQALQTIVATDSTAASKHARQLNGIAESEPYLYPQVLKIWLHSEANKAFLSRINTTIGRDDPLKSMFAVNVLNGFWSHKNLKQKGQYRKQVREAAWQALALHDRGVTYAAESLLEDSLLFNKEDFPRINRSLRAFNLPGDIEVYQSFGALYKKRFENQARPVIDSLAALNSAPLNRSLKQAGWEVNVPGRATPNFRNPNWQRLWQLGRHPIWVLKTKKGTIKVRMNTLSAPATVSAIDSLTRSGAYNGVPFHRVVPNFVIQGGDIERQDGFGGPDFTIPTEASEQGFVRGAAGIASAGTDTEGSQYFFMLQRAPHLNGRYTLFGHVVEGMDVVDRIMVGDKVRKTYWE